MTPVLSSKYRAFEARQPRHGVGVRYALHVQSHGGLHRPRQRFDAPDAALQIAGTLPTYSSRSTASQHTHRAQDETVLH